MESPVSHYCISYSECIPTSSIAGVSVGSIVSRVIIDVDVVGSAPARDSFFQQWIGRKCESASWLNSMQIDEHKKLKNGHASRCAR